MLHIKDDYYAQTNNFGYTVLRKNGRKGKDDQELYTTLGYVGCLQEVLDLVLKDSVQRKIAGADIELSETLQYIKEQTDRILKAMEGIEV